MAIKEPKPETRIIWDSDTLERMNVQVDGKFEAGFLRVPVERMRLRRYVEFEKLGDAGDLRSTAERAGLRGHRQTRGDRL